MLFVEDVATPVEASSEEFSNSEEFSASMHVNTARRAVDSLVRVVERGDWRVTSSSRDVELSSSKCGAFQGKCILPPTISLRDLKAFLSDYRTRHLIDDYLEEVQLIDVYKNSESEIINLQYLSYKRTLMVSGREFLITTCVQDIDDNAFVIASTSVEDSRYSQPRNGRVRASLLIGGYMARQMATGVELVMISNTDLGGKLPEMLTAPIQRQKPAEFLQKIKVQLSRLKL